MAREKLSSSPLMDIEAKISEKWFKKFGPEIRKALPKAVMEAGTLTTIRLKERARGHWEGKIGHVVADSIINKNIVTGGHRESLILGNKYPGWITEWGWERRDGTIQPARKWIWPTIQGLKKEYSDILVKEVRNKIRKLSKQKKVVIRGKDEEGW